MGKVKEETVCREGERFSPGQGWSEERSGGFHPAGAGGGVRLKKKGFTLVDEARGEKGCLEVGGGWFPNRSL